MAAMDTANTFFQFFILFPPLLQFFTNISQKPGMNLKPGPLFLLCCFHFFIFFISSHPLVNAYRRNACSTGRIGKDAGQKQERR